MNGFNLSLELDRNCSMWEVVSKLNKWMEDNSKLLIFGYDFSKNDLTGISIESFYNSAFGDGPDDGSFLRPSEFCSLNEHLCRFSIIKGLPDVKTMIDGFNAVVCKQNMSIVSDVLEDISKKYNTLTWERAFTDKDIYEKYIHDVYPKLVESCIRHYNDLFRENKQVRFRDACRKIYEDGEYDDLMKPLFDLSVKRFFNS